MDNKAFLCIVIHIHKSMCKIRCSYTQKWPSFAILDLVTLTLRLQMKFFTLQFTVIIHYTSLPKSHICIELHCLFFKSKASLGLSNFKVQMSVSCYKLL